MILERQLMRLKYHLPQQKEKKMSSKRYSWSAAVLLIMMLVWGCCTGASAEGLSNDNSLSSLGILTEGAEVSPEFTYGTTEYEVKVPAGTQKLELDPVPSHEGAWIVSITGTELTDGKATVEILVSAESGEQYPYYLHVTADGSAASGAAAEPETEAQTQQQTETEPETEPQTEDPRYVKVDRNSLQEAENTIAALKEETSSYRDRVGILMKILYGLIAFCVVLLFIVINLVLKKKDMKAELNDYRSLGYPAENTAEYSNGQGYDGQAYDTQGYDSQEFAGQDFGSQEFERQDLGSQEPVGQDVGGQDFDAWDVSGKSVMEDDPATVPKPSRARKQRKTMPKYEEPAKQEYSYQEPASGTDRDKNVEVTMIDL